MVALYPYYCIIDLQRFSSNSYEILSYQKSLLNKSKIISEVKREIEGYIVECSLSWLRYESKTQISKQIVKGL